MGRPRFAAADSAGRMSRCCGLDSWRCSSARVGGRLSLVRRNSTSVPEEEEEEVVNLSQHLRLICMQINEAINALRTASQAHQRMTFLQCQSFRPVSCSEPKLGLLFRQVQQLSFVKLRSLL